MREVSKCLLLIYVVLLAAASVMPFGGTSASLNRIEVLSFRLDYLLHALIFIPLAPFWRIAYPKHPWWLIISGSVFLAVAAEAVHYVVPYRSYNVNDLLGNTIGAMIGAGIAFFMNLLNMKRTSRKIPRAKAVKKIRVKNN